MPAISSPSERVIALTPLAVLPMQRASFSLKTYAHTLPCSYEYLLFAVGELYISQFVALVEIYREYSVFADVLICVKLGTLDNAVFW